jgi:hypothetical protein
MEDLMKKLVSISLLMLFAFSAWSNPELNGFKKRFKFIRDKESNKVIAVKAKFIVSDFAIMPYLNMIKKSIKKQQEIARASGNQLLSTRGINSYEDYIDRVFEEMDHIELDTREGLSNRRQNESDIIRRKSTLKKSLLNLTSVNIDQVMNQIARKGIMAEYQKRLKNIFLQFRLDLIANLDDSRYFYRRNVTHKVVTWGLNQAKKRFSSVPLLNTASYIIVEVEKLLREQRMLSQNILLHYLSEYEPEELGISEEELYKLQSSIYESRIAWTGFQESNRAAKDWLAYGPQKFFNFVLTGKNRLRRVRYVFKDIKKINFAFVQAEEEGVKKIYNVLDGRHMFNSKPAVAINLDKPYAVRNLRNLLRLGQLGLSFVSLPNFIKSAANSFANSVYKVQALNEGALLGYFEAKNQAGKELIFEQIGNPFLQQ